MTRFQFVRFTAAAVLIGAWCAVAQAATTVVFVDKNVLNVDATSLELRIDSNPPQEYPHVNYRSNFKFEDAAREWAESHFKLTGGSVNKLLIVIRQGDIVEQLLPVKKGVKGWFTKDQAYQYVATLDLELAIVDPNGKVLTSSTGKAKSSRTLGESATEADKQQVWTDLIIKSFDALDNEMQPQLRQVMAQYIR